ncbi:MAG: hypothetical protein FWF87_04125 [Synergistaceae bacterium]|nr:hypothetical protein [Synergistaceae bacterium]
MYFRQPDCYRKAACFYEFIDVQPGIVRKFSVVSRRSGRPGATDGQDDLVSRRSGRPGATDGQDDLVSRRSGRPGATEPPINEKPFALSTYMSFFAYFVWFVVNVFYLFLFKKIKYIFQKQ